MMAILFCFFLLVYYAVFFRKKSKIDRGLALILWITYFALGCAAIIFDISDISNSIFQPNYKSLLFLVICLFIGISGFLSFRSSDLSSVIANIRGQKLIETILVVLQSFAILFFLPFALSSFDGDANINRLELDSKAQVLGSYGLVNTFASMACHLFPVTLVMAFIRLARPDDGRSNVWIAALLTFVSLSYVFYVLAYVGRDGVVLWIMTASALFVTFRGHLSKKRRRQVLAFGLTTSAILFLPLFAITVARFVGSDFGIGWSILDYFGSQIQTFSDFSSIDRPLTYGVMNFPIFTDALCPLFYNQCESWSEIKNFVFDQYLLQGKAPWLFGTYVSDFVADFGYLGALLALSVFSLMCHFTCAGRDSTGRMSIARLLLIIFFFLVPYWGVFYFRLGIANSSIIANLAFIIFVWFVQRFTSPESTREFPNRLTSERYMPRR
jgi:hypothetical protein